MFKKLVVLGLILQFSMSATAADVCAAFLTPEGMEQHLTYSTNNNCVVSRDALGHVKNAQLIGNNDHDVYGSVDVYKHTYKPYTLTAVLEDIVIILDDEDQALPPTVAADLGIISAWMLTDMYAN